MVGDTVRTDIAGAKNCGIKSILVTGFGSTADELETGITLEELYQREGVEPDWVINLVSEIK